MSGAGSYLTKTHKKTALPMQKYPFLHISGSGAAMRQAKRRKSLIL
jgi:hypothetical protein